MTFRSAASLMVGAVALAAAVSVPLAVNAGPRSSAQRGSSSTTTWSRPTTSTTTPSVPNVDGMSLAKAQRALIASGHGALTLKELVAEPVERGVAPETVISQTDGKFTVSVPGAAACRQAQLAVTYLSEQGAVGNNYAGIVLRNVSPTWCAVPGPLHLVGLSETGQAVTTTLVVTFSNPRADVLSPNTPPAPEPSSSTAFAFDSGGYPIDVLYAWVGFGGVHSGCGAGDYKTYTPRYDVTPASWRLSAPHTFSFTAANGTPVEAAKHPSDTYAVRVARPFWDCGGRILPAAPAFR